MVSAIERFQCIKLQFVTKRGNPNFSLETIQYAYLFKTSETVTAISAFPETPSTLFSFIRTSKFPLRLAILKYFPIFRLKYS